MATRKRKPARSDLVSRAVSAGRRALREAESRVPPDLRRQLQRSLRDADKTARAAIKQLQSQVQKASTRADVNNVLKRIDGLTRQARTIVGGGGGASPAGPAQTRRAATSPTRRPASRARKPAAAAATRRTPARKPRAKKASAPVMPETMAPPESAGEGGTV